MATPLLLALAGRRLRTRLVGRGGRAPAAADRTDLAAGPRHGADDPAAGLRPGPLDRHPTALAVETLVQTVPRAGVPRTAISEEHRAIRRLCVAPISVAEVSARLGLPLGATRLALDEMARGGLLVLHLQACEAPTHELMARVVEGLRRL